MNIILLGKPGAGKGFVSDILKGEYGFNHISTGNLCRENIKNNTEIGKIANEYIQKGELVPLDYILRMLKEELEKSSNANCVFDGFPRTIAQAEELKSLANIDAVVLVDVEDKIIFNRIENRRICPNCSKLFIANELKEEICTACNTKLIKRADDNVEVAKKRIDSYNIDTKPLLDYYKDKLFILDNSKDVAYLKAQIKNLMNKF